MFELSMIRKTFPFHQKKIILVVLDTNVVEWKRSIWFFVAVLIKYRELFLTIFCGYIVSRDN